MQFPWDLCDFLKLTIFHVFLLMDNISIVILFTVSVWTFLLNLVIGFVLTENLIIWLYFNYTQHYILRRINNECINFKMKLIGKAKLIIFCRFYIARVSYLQTKIKKILVNSSINCIWKHLIWVTSSQAQTFLW